ncbi:MAG: catalase [Clostridia bacterium]|nr:catalase [Clostridia bacterium]
MIKNIIGHTKTIVKHRWIVFKLACKAGIPWRGFVHDLSKFSPTEFWEGVKYYVGVNSPITEAKKDKGYSEAWLHHKGKNKHHPEYWVDYDVDPIVPVIPYKYAVEKVCDDLSAGIVYNGKNWTQDLQYNYYMKQREIVLINPKIDNFLTEVYFQVKENGIEKTINKKNMKHLYKKHCIDDKTKYIYKAQKGLWEIVNK